MTRHDMQIDRLPRHYPDVSANRKASEGFPLPGIRRHEASCGGGGQVPTCNCQHLPLDIQEIARQLVLLQTPSRAALKENTVVRLKNIEPLTLNGLEMAHRFAHGVLELGLKE
ncbi:MAG TPA: hypothetical protein VGN68_00755 [Sphingopyxis sp.]|jgi:hypothetical protein|uniref:hypothetical protein n=1 Tax=Sphingopyxis sp. TaxID=1908224 RepID=UPI002E10A838|nr:hypothetical protein [Sphingopyxis sp.]